MVAACACAVAGGAFALPSPAAAVPAQYFFISDTDAFVSASELPGGQLRRTYVRPHRLAAEMGADPGRDVLRRGVRIRDGRVREATRRDLRRAVRGLRRMTAPVSVTGSYAGVSGATLDSIAQCESGGDPTAIGGGGLYRGKYQFSYGTWESVGGSGDPAAASEAEQDRRAATLLARDGAGHWPVCG